MGSEEPHGTFTQCPFCSSREYRILYAFSDQVSMCECDCCSGRFQTDL